MAARTSWPAGAPRVPACAGRRGRAAARRRLLCGTAVVPPPSNFPPFATTPCSEELLELLGSQPWGDKTHRYFLTREQEYVGGLQSAVGIW